MKRRRDHTSDRRCQPSVAHGPSMYSGHTEREEGPDCQEWSWTWPESEREKMAKAAPLEKSSWSERGGEGGKRVIRGRRKSFTRTTSHYRRR